MNASEDFFCCLDSHESILSIQGDDAVALLQGQTTCDVREVSDTQTRLGAICNPKGRALATFRLIRWQDEYLMLLPAELLPGVLKRLQMFVFRSKVKIANASDRFALFGLCGSICNDAEFDVSGLQAGACHSEADQCLIRAPHAEPSALLVCESEQAESIAQTLEQRLGRPADAASRWRLLEVENGIPRLSHATQELFVPQMINIDLLDGISFKKGCYTGQEIVARMHYLGNLKKRMYKFTSTGDVAPASKLFTASDSEHSVGTVLDCIPHPAGHRVVLAVCQIGLDPGTPLLPENSTTFIERATLPYTLEAQD